LDDGSGSGSGIRHRACFLVCLTPPPLVFCTRSAIRMPAAAAALAVVCVVVVWRVDAKGSRARPERV
jgi:hypothetical protein